ncbi:uncharacterized protein LOC134776258 [Penaeus indicus]|uniref:uncharacterized protein LOC134776258 n=1 Tax=Penaeus indicus TaxID=29960 RepID=UPI00300CF2AA
MLSHSPLNSSVNRTAVVQAQAVKNLLEHPPTSKPSLESVALPSSSFGTLDSPADYSSVSLSTQLSSTPSSFGGPRLVTFASRPQEGFLYSVSEASSAPYETTFPPTPSGREQSSSFTSEKGDPTLSSEAPRGVGEHHAEVRLVSSEASGDTCQRLAPFHPSPSVKISVSFADSSKVETQRASSYLSLYSDPTTAAQVVRPTPTLPEGVVLSPSRPEHGQGTNSLYTLRPDSSCSVQPPAVTSYRSSFVTAVSSSPSPSSTSVSSTPNASSTPIVSSTSAAPTRLSTPIASTAPSILYVSSTPSVLSGPGIPSGPNVPSKPDVPITPTAPAMPYHPANHSALPTSTVQSTFSLPPVIPFPPSSLTSSSSTALPPTSGAPPAQVTSSSIPPPSSAILPSLSVPAQNSWSEPISLRTPSSQPNAASSSSDPSPAVTGPPDTHSSAPFTPISSVPITCSSSSTSTNCIQNSSRTQEASPLPVPGNQSPGASSSSCPSVSLCTSSVPRSATSESATPSAEPLNLVTNNQSLDLSCGKRPLSLKIAPTPTWRRSSAPYRPPLVGRRSQPWRPW